MEPNDFVFEDDKLYLFIPVSYSPTIYEKRLVMTKDIFVECLERWVIAPKGEDA